MPSLAFQSISVITPPLRLRRVSVEEYERMIQDGYFARDERFELLDGLILEKMPKNPPHSTVCSRLKRFLEGQLPEHLLVRGEQPLKLTRSMPEPDALVVPGPDTLYTARHPGVADVLLLIEVSDSTLEVDRGIKLREYALEGIDRYYIVNIVERCIECYDAPRGETYLNRTVIQGNETLELQIRDIALRLEVAKLFQGLVH